MASGGQLTLNPWDFVPSSSWAVGFLVSSSDTAMLRHGPHRSVSWPMKWFPGLVSNLPYHYGPVCDLWGCLTLTTTNEPSADSPVCTCFWLGLEPASLLYICLRIGTFPWTWLPPPGLPCSPCSGPGEASVLRVPGLLPAPQPFGSSWHCCTLAERPWKHLDIYACMLMSLLDLNLWSVSIQCLW